MNYETAKLGIDQLKTGYDRYEIVRRLTPVEFASVYKENLKGEKTFDQLVDELGKKHE